MRVTIRALVAGLALALTAATGVAGAPSAGAAVVDPADESQDFPFPGADAIALHDGSNKYITYGASSGGKKVPYAISGSGDVVGTSPTVAGDAMPSGGGAWVEAGSGIWTPGAFYHVKDGVGRYYLFYTATRKNDDGRKCIGVARSQNPYGAFTAEDLPIGCPDKGSRWALDADVTAGPAGAIWMTWRDGQRAEGQESALSVMMLKINANGAVDRNSDPVVIFRSDNLSWVTYRETSGVAVIENPSVFYHNGSWYLFYSGNAWRENYYSTGIAFCGDRIDDGLCSPMPGPNRAWFSYSGPAAHLPDTMRKYSLPGNKRGPGAMGVYRARDGKPWVTWNYLADDSSGRKSRTGRLVITGSGSNADFRVEL
ncbi:family 43 glycosylhydrolase [Micromonospora aurantiaca]|nr:family 43 glycosylhydrolase [Micromonospora aurantiaca]